MSGRHTHANDERLDRYFHGEMDLHETAQLLRDIEKDSELRDLFEREKAYHEAISAAVLQPQRDLKSAVIAKITEEEVLASKKKQGVWRYFSKAAPVLAAAAIFLCVAWNIDLIQSQVFDPPTPGKETVQSPVIALRPADSSNELPQGNAVSENSAQPSSGDSELIDFTIEISRWLVPYVYPSGTFKFELGPDRAPAETSQNTGKDTGSTEDSTAKASIDHCSKCGYARDCILNIK